jgi:hypothetical protein
LVILLRQKRYGGGVRDGGFKIRLGVAAEVTGDFVETPSFPPRHLGGYDFEDGFDIWKMHVSNNGRGGKTKEWLTLQVTEEAKVTKNCQWQKSGNYVMTNGPWLTRIGDLRNH